MGEFVKVLKKSDLPENSCKQTEIGGKGLAVMVCNIKGAYHAMDATCPHMGGPLGEGDLDGNVVACPWHGWTFDVMTGNCLIRPGVKQSVYAVKTEGDDILVSL
ncbi:MAG: Rieske (2Fe-2S) protein [Candidatus Omnitrophica bacterium]|nr:Rieske (2Fe-2S) protein [Candidatus Omnitrophota bacterium]